MWSLQGRGRGEGKGEWRDGRDGHLNSGSWLDTLYMIGFTPKKIYASSFINRFFTALIKNQKQSQRSV
jgi:hypothetical protein